MSPHRMTEQDRIGWYEFITANEAATTHIAYVYSDGSIYLPEGPIVVDETDFHMASAAGRCWRLIRGDGGADHIDTLTAKLALAETALAAYRVDHAALTAERDALRAILHADIDYHVIELRDDGWTVMHPFAERLKPETLFACHMRWEDGDIGVRGCFILNDDGTLGAPWQDNSPSPAEPSDGYRQARGVVDLHGEPAETVIRRQRGE